MRRRLPSQGVHERVAQHLLGHADSPMTRLIYTHVTGSMLDGAAAAVERAARSVHDAAVPSGPQPPTAPRARRREGSNCRPLSFQATAHRPATSRNRAVAGQTARCRPQADGHRAPRCRVQVVGLDDRTACPSASSTEGPKLRRCAHGGPTVLGALVGLSNGSLHRGAGAAPQAVRASTRVSVPLRRPVPWSYWELRLPICSRAAMSSIRRASAVWSRANATRAAFHACRPRAPRSARRRQGGPPMQPAPVDCP